MWMNKTASYVTNKLCGLMQKSDFQTHNEQFCLPTHKNFHSINHFSALFTVFQFKFSFFLRRVCVSERAGICFSAFLFLIIVCDHIGLINNGFSGSYIGLNILWDLSEKNCSAQVWPMGSQGRHNLTTSKWSHKWRVWKAGECQRSVSTAH